MASNHFDADGNAHMVDVSAKSVTRRSATASACIAMNNAAAELVRSGESRKGDVLAVARLAAISATKWTAHLIPLCHAIPIESVSVDFQWVDQPEKRGRRALAQPFDKCDKIHAFNPLESRLTYA